MFKNASFYLFCLLENWINDILFTWLYLPNFSKNEATELNHCPLLFPYRDCGFQKLEKINYHVCIKKFKLLDQAILRQQDNSRH